MGLIAMFGPSGLLAAPMITTVNGDMGTGVGVYIAGLLISYLVINMSVSVLQLQ